MGALIKLQRRQPMLAVDDQEFLVRNLQMADGFIGVDRSELQLLRREQQHRAGNRRLGDGRLVEVPDRFDF